MKNHLKDKHKGKWDKFSIYLIRKADHIREIESLILRISDPTGNVVRGRLSRATNIKSELASSIRQKQQSQLVSLLGRKKLVSKRTGAKKRRLRPAAKGTAPLAPYFDHAQKIKGTLKGKTYTARVRKNGLIYYKGVLHKTPSMAGKAAVGRSINGWTFWRYKDTTGGWKLIDKLRK